MDDILSENVPSCEDIIIDFGDICRICLSETKERISLYENVPNEKDCTISSMIEVVSSVKFQKNDGFPSAICAQCFENASRTYYFILQCKQSDAALKDCYEKTLSQAKAKFTFSFEPEVIVKEEEISSDGEDVRLEQVTDDLVQEISPKTDGCAADHEYAMSLENVKKAIRDEDLLVPVVSEKNILIDGLISYDDTFLQFTNDNNSSLETLQTNEDYKKPEVSKKKSKPGMSKMKLSKKLKKVKNLRKILRKEGTKKEEIAEQNSLSQKLKVAQMKLEEDIKRSNDLVTSLQRDNDVTNSLKMVCTTSAYKYSCNQCSNKIRFSTDIAYIRHQIIKHKRQKSDILSSELNSCRFLVGKRPDKLFLPEAKHYTCNNCNFKFANSDDLKMHKHECHNESVVVVDEFASTLTNKDFDKIFKCLLCDEASDSVSLMSHRCKAVCNSDTNNEIISEKEDIVNKPNLSSQSKYNCNACNVSLVVTSRADLLKHVKEVHQSEMSSYKCEKCPLKPAFKTKHKFNRHIASYHKESEIFEDDFNEKNAKIEFKENIAVVSDNDLQFRDETFQNQTEKLYFESYTCSLCTDGTNFQLPSQLEAHINQKHKSINKSNSAQFMKENVVKLDSLTTGDDNIFLKRYVCTICQPYCSFKYQAEYIEHQKIVHKRLVNKIDKKELKPVLLNDSGTQLFEVLEVDNKKEKIETKDAFSKKVLDEHNIGNRRVWKCEEQDCDAAYGKKYGLQKHYKDKHKKQLKIHGYTCPFQGCGETFLTNKKVIHHGVIVHKQYFADFDDIYKSKILLQPLIDADQRKRKYECDLCKRKYLRKSSLRGHINNHLGNKTQESAICSYCGKMVVDKAYLKAHIEQKHEITTVPCPVCKKEINLRYLRRHYSVHQIKLEMENGVPSSQKKYLCNMCGRVLKTKSGFIVHEKLHNNIRDFVCDICGSGFTSRNSLNIHKNIHAGELRKVFECDQCNKVFNGKHTLKRHLLTHTGQKNFICEVCSKDFYTIQELNRHIKFHTKVKKYECKICNKKFSETSGLRVHVMRHKNIKPYECNFCDRKFVARYKLHLHLQSRHHIQVLNTKGVWKDPKSYIPLDDLLKM